MIKTQIYDSWVLRYALCIRVICLFYASGYKENFPRRDDKDDLKSRGSERRNEQGFSSLLKVPSGGFIVNKQLFKCFPPNQPVCVHPSSRTNMLDVFHTWWRIWKRFGSASSSTSQHLFIDSFWLSDCQDLTQALFSTNGDSSWWVKG